MSDRDPFALGGYPIPRSHPVAARFVDELLRLMPNYASISATSKDRPAPPADPVLLLAAERERPSPSCAVR